MNIGGGGVPPIKPPETWGSVLSPVEEPTTFRQVLGIIDFLLYMGCTMRLSLSSRKQINFSSPKESGSPARRV